MKIYIPLCESNSEMSKWSKWRRSGVFIVNFENKNMNDSHDM